MGPERVALRMATVAMAVVLLSSTLAPCTDASGDMMQKASDFAESAKETGLSWAEWAQDKISQGLGFQQDNDKGTPSDDNIAEKSKLDFDKPLTADAFDISQKIGVVKEAVETAVGGVSEALPGLPTDGYAIAKARSDEFERLKEKEILLSRP